MDHESWHDPKKEETSYRTQTLTSMASSPTKPSNSVKCPVSVLSSRHNKRIGEYSSKQQTRGTCCAGIKIKKKK